MHPRFTPFSAVALKFAAGYVIRLFTRFHPGGLPLSSGFHPKFALRFLSSSNPAFMFRLIVVVLANVLSEVRSDSACASSFRAPVSLAGFRFGWVWLLPVALLFPLPSSWSVPTSFRLLFCPSVHPRLIKACVLSSPAGTNIRRYNLPAQIFYSG